MPQCCRVVGGGNKEIDTTPHRIVCMGADPRNMDAAKICKVTVSCSQPRARSSTHGFYPVCFPAS